MVAAGMGGSVVPEMAIAPHTGCRFIPIADEYAQRRIGLEGRKNRYTTRAAVVGGISEGYGAYSQTLRKAV
jgi:hypothetical protein